MGSLNDPIIQTGKGLLLSISPIKIPTEEQFYSRQGVYVRDFLDYTCPCEPGSWLGCSGIQTLFH